MDAKKLFLDAENAYIYLERYVNNGSPTGFHRRSTSIETSPFNGRERFPLLEFGDKDLECIYLGSKHELFEKGINYAHPDSLKSKNLEAAGREIVESGIVVSPTASGRTMLMRSPSGGGFLKLTYDVSKIGILNRQMTLNHCQTSLEVSKSLKNRIDRGKLPITFSLFLEESSKVSILKTGDKKYEWGTIYREGKPYPYTDKNIVLIPGFSLFSKDTLNINDEVLINQFIELSGGKPRDYLVNLLKMIVDCYWEVVLNCAFHPECHAQNCLFELDEEYNIVRMVIRDMDSVDKDIPLAKHFGLNDKWETSYMCFDGSIYFYSVRSSFIYDFKVGEYLLSPIIDVVAAKYNLNKLEIENEIKAHVKENYTWQLPNSYFPADGCWYNHDNTERRLGEKRKYFAHKNPKYR
jgi:hypothetical protein